MGHDLESFFAVIVWMASYAEDEETYLAKPLVQGLLWPKDSALDYFFFAKDSLCGRRATFERYVVGHFEPPGSGGTPCLWKRCSN